LKTPQIIICIFMGMLGITMVIHFWGNLGPSAIVSDVVGIALIAIGVFSIILYFRQRLKKKTRAN